MHAGPAEPQSSSDQLPEAMSGKTKTVGVPRSLIIGTSFAFCNEMLIPPPTGLTASEAALVPASLTAGLAACPVLAKSVHGVQWSSTRSFAGSHRQHRGDGVGCHIEGKAIAGCNTRLRLVDGAGTAKYGSNTLDNRLHQRGSLLAHRVIEVL